MPQYHRNLYCLENVSLQFPARDGVYWVGMQGWLRRLDNWALSWPSLLSHEPIANWWIEERAAEEEIQDKSFQIKLLRKWGLLFGFSPSQSQTTIA